MQKRIFRKDINGLRALAVMSVILFHFNSNYLPGGFAGVDIFFVISGYLMTSIIFKGLEGNNFSTLKFFQARARRVVPALIAVIVTVLFLGYLFFEPLTYQLVGKHGLSSLLFISNIIYANESGYFDLDSFSKLFLHTWSLSVEWQFYIIYPIVLVALSKFLSINNIKKIILVLTILSLLLCIYISSKDLAISYFMLYTRAWEILFGGLAFLFPVNFESNKKRIVEILGISLIILSFIIFSNNNLWPSYNALLPVFGAYLCILANSEKTLLSNAIFQRLGLWSYSIYLVHWPILVFSNKLNITINVYVYLLIVISISILIYETIEKKRSLNFKLFVAYVIAILSLYLVMIDGAKYRVREDFQLKMSDYRSKFEGHLGIRNSDTIQYMNSTESDFDYILIGDSHARHYFSFIKDEKIKVASLALDGCNSTKNYYSSFNKEMCKIRYKKEIDFINSHPEKPIIISKLWPGINNSTIKRDANEKINNNDYENIMIDELRSFINETSNSNHQYFIIGDTQGSNRVMFECLAKSSLPINKLFKLNDCDSYQMQRNRIYNIKLKEFSEGMKNVYYIDPDGALCDSGKCLVVYNDMPIYTDKTHLSKIGSSIVGNYIFKSINKNR
ncbi:putative acetyltransferase [Xenorhabdus vietnamensis]|uniref:Putative acetyltransferase n=1 Tax=Xenorhabdus vietnamensis TaxID=351656 RepID=A0A1Y2SJM9_9GAMM|nr:acyltransferase family protein [Xenorhabdus vietnamensis]OTA18234.1 putative acetyltransferase [Xenorhabdus vietnamensis]